MNQKANVSKELNAKHRKILEGLFKLPENRECADCKTKGPRWASVNLGIFVCMQCSGIHRSLGVHISKVRSATLDTWLPEQIAFIQSMGNEKSNEYWEAELPRNYDRVGIENFIRAKYEEKRWIPRDGKKRVIEQKKASLHTTTESNVRQIYNVVQFPGERKVMPLPVTNGSNPAYRNRQKRENSGNLVLEERKVTPLPKLDSKLVPESSTPPMLVKVSLLQVTRDSKPQEPVTNSEPIVSKTELVRKEEKTTAAKVDYATELFNLLCMDDSNCINNSSSGNASASFQSATIESTSGRSDASNESESKMQNKHDQPLLANNAIMNVFEKSSMAPPFSVQQQQALLASHINANHSANHNWGSTSYQGHGIRMAAPYLQNHVQVGNNLQTHSVGSSVYTQVSRAAAEAGAMNGGTGMRSTMPVAAATQPQLYYDLSYLTEGIYKKS